MIWTLKLQESAFEYTILSLSQFQWMIYKIYIESSFNPINAIKY